MGGIDSALQSFTDLKITKCFGHLFSCSFFKKVKQDRRKKESTKKFRQFILVPFFELKSIRILNILGHNFCSSTKKQITIKRRKLFLSKKNCDDSEFGKPEFTWVEFFLCKQRSQKVFKVERNGV